MRKNLTLLAAILVAVLAVSCAASKWTTLNMKNKEEVESVLSSNPELYARYQKGEIVLDKIKYQPQPDGSTQYRFTYHEVNNDDSNDDLLEWLTIFVPMMTN
ncbi:MAG: hypothetical protein J6U53_03635 [Tidjanibacter sp.]|nr:hypothetical protein [Tidjanibacter sp.]